MKLDNRDFIYNLSRFISIKFERDFMIVEMEGSLPARRQAITRQVIPSTSREQQVGGP
jgi:hypothetical protein